MRDSLRLVGGGKLGVGGAGAENEILLVDATGGAGGTGSISRACAALAAASIFVHPRYVLVKRHSSSY
jgi:hypothetical protein